MNKERQDLIEKMLKEMFLAFRAMKPDHDHEKENKGSHFGKGFLWPRFGRGHMDLFFKLGQNKNGLTVKEIAESLHITPGAVTQLVDHLVENGVVSRNEDPNDRRSQIIKFSEKTKDRIEGFRKHFVEKIGPKLTNLTDEEISQLAQLLGKINKSEKETA